MWDQISVPAGEELVSFTECVFQITHPNWKEEVRDKFQEYFTYYPPDKDKETKVLTRILREKEPNFLSPLLDFLDHHGPRWAGLSCPMRLQVAKAGRLQLQSEDILATFYVQTATILQRLFLLGALPCASSLVPFWSFPWTSESPCCGNTGRGWLSPNMPATCQVSKEIPQGTWWGHAFFWWLICGVSVRYYLSREIQVWHASQEQTPRRYYPSQSFWSWLLGILKSNESIRQKTWLPKTHGNYFGEDNE